MLIPQPLYLALKAIGRLSQRAYDAIATRIEITVPVESYDMTDDQFERLLYGCTDDPPLPKTSRD